MNSTDPRIITIAGPPPSDIDLNANTATSDRAAIITVFILALLAISLRFAARTIQRTRIHWDDWIIILSMVLVSGTAGLAIAGGFYGAGKHIWAVRMEDLEQIYKILFGVCAASAVRIHFLTELTKTVNVTRAMGPVFIWSDLEPCIAIVSACLPHLAPLRHIIRHRISSTFGSERGKGTDSSSKKWGGGESNAKGPMFTYGGSRYFGAGDKLKFGDNDDEVELTNRVIAGSQAGRQTPSRSISADSVVDRSIYVQTSYTQTAEHRR
ncbi:related to integral membrane protein [Fusarium torulosum]|uniref:Related to integral membrane protein n=1 Tax=Fusarium torulosum TaxID=33205 RepID=A0AAE8M430_9HYPO|nr:related to integral membrane protein [Fusarium torulosum]